ncbi:hypothetical protein BO1005MUT1_540004 [Hyphomicrobiales bacterium]|nr:hypothetical protein BO1005MUT1_540004 [Hyphomicrobiales bacterium]
MRGASVLSAYEHRPRSGWGPNSQPCMRLVSTTQQCWFAPLEMPGDSEPELHEGFWIWLGGFKAATL